MSIIAQWIHSIKMYPTRWRWFGYNIASMIEETIFSANFADAFVQDGPRGQTVSNKMSPVEHHVDWRTCIVDLNQVALCIIGVHGVGSMARNMQTILTPYGFVRSCSLRSHRCVYNICCVIVPANRLVYFLWKDRYLSTDLMVLASARFHQRYRKAKNRTRN